MDFGGLRKGGDSCELVLEKLCKSKKIREYVDGLRDSSVGSDVVIECLVRTYPFEAEAILKGFYVDFDELEENAPACGCRLWGSD